MPEMDSFLATERPGRDGPSESGAPNPHLHQAKVPNTKSEQNCLLFLKNCVRQSVLSVFIPFARNSSSLSRAGRARYIDNILPWCQIDDHQVHGISPANRAEGVSRCSVGPVRVPGTGTATITRRETRQPKRFAVPLIRLVVADPANPDDDQRLVNHTVFNCVT
jgi:hypothetical protein